MLVALLAACAMDPAADGVSAVQFQDVVVPSGLRLRDDAHESYSREEAGWRQGHFVYVGQTDASTAADYVRGRMPQHGWTKVQDEADGEGGFRLGFHRDVYRAAYSLRRGEGFTTMVVDYTTDYQRR
ncbi:MAG: hypothetical protein WAT39_20310 [Planctomycetota bacterium]